MAMTVTDALKVLLQQYGILSITLNELSKRPGSPFDALEDYLSSLGPISHDEPVLIVTPSKDGSTHFIDLDPNHEISEALGKSLKAVTKWELPEDEFWFLKAFRPGLFDLEKRLPIFIYEISLVYAYDLFEMYVADVLR
jgi:hypothetical protein